MSWRCIHVIAARNSRRLFGRLSDSLPLTVEPAFEGFMRISVKMVSVFALKMGISFADGGQEAFPPNAQDELFYFFCS